MSLIPFSKARAQLTDIVNHVAFGGKRIVLTRKGKKVAAIIPLEDLELIEIVEDQIDLEESKKVKRDIKKHGTIPWKAIKKELSL